LFVGRWLVIVVASTQQLGRSNIIERPNNVGSADGHHNRC
jgi:hypothetical protein